MKRKEPALLFVIFLGCSSTTEPSGTSDPTSSSEADAWVAAHNAVRAKVKTSPAIPQVEWSNELAAIAQANAAKCKFEHSGAKDLGENLYASGGKGRNPGGAVEAWEKEEANFNHATQTCAKGVCGHYTQVIWRATTKIGCAIEDCSSKGGYAQNVFCNYSPPGNYVGQKAY